MTFTLEQAKESVRYWQQILRLQDWNIDVDIRRKAEMNSPSASAQVWRGTYYRRAELSLLDPIDYTKNTALDGQDLDYNIVHELLHLHLHDCHVPDSETDDPSPEEIAEERAIDAIARALVDLNA